MTTPKLLRFESFTLDLERLCLQGPSGRPADLRRKSFEVLRYLVEHAGRVVTKQEMLNSVWPDVTVSDESLTQCISEVRRALRDTDQRIIKTIPRRGYLIDVPVSADDVTTGQPFRATIAGASRSSALPLLGYLVPKLRDGRQKITASFVALRQLARGTRWGTLAAAASPLVIVGAAGMYLLVRSAMPIGNSGQPPAQLSAIAVAAHPTRPTFKDCDVCPEMVALPAGEFMMGSPEDDAGRLQVEGRPRRVVIARQFAIGRFEITVDQFAAFAEETGTALSKSFNPCHVTIGFDLDPPYWTASPEASFRRPGFDVTGTHPAGCVSWYDGQAYAAWLRRRTGKPYRLPTEVEWEYAARAGTATRYSFGDDERLLCDHGRFADLATRYAWRDGCRSGMATDGPIQVGKLKPNAWGLFDMHGNVWEWVEDCWTPNWAEIPTDGSAFARPSNCEMGVIRGGSWISKSRNLRSAFRQSARTPMQSQVTGFRVALSMDAP